MMLNWGWHPKRFYSISFNVPHFNLKILAAVKSQRLEVKLTKDSGSRSQWTSWFSQPLFCWLQVPFYGRNYCCCFFYLYTYLHVYYHFLTKRKTWKQTFELLWLRYTYFRVLSSTAGVKQNHCDNRKLISVRKMTLYKNEDILTSTGVDLILKIQNL